MKIRVLTQSYVLLIPLLIFLGGCGFGNQDPNSPDQEIREIQDAVGDIVLINDVFQGNHLLIAGSAQLNFVVSFEKPENLTFESIQGSLPVIMQSDEGSKWNVFGEAIEGPLTGQQLTPTHSLMGFWMTFGAFFPGVEIFEGEKPDSSASILQSTNSEWLVPQERVFDGGPGKDGIPALENPNFGLVQDNNYLQPEDLVLGIKRGDDIRAYPHKILDWHEIVNDRLGDLSLAVTYCPLTGTASAWNRVLDGVETTFGVSGLLYNTNLMPFDRETDSYWSQMRFDCVYGDKRGKMAEVFQMVETTWQTWANMYPDTRVLTTETGFNRNYFTYPYGDYRTNDNRLIFPVEFDDQRLGRKERVHAVIVGDVAKVYPLEIF